MHYTSLICSFFDWTMMPRKLYLALCALMISALMGCGTGIGNPGSPFAANQDLSNLPPSLPTSASEIFVAYHDHVSTNDCGNNVNIQPSQSVSEIRTCIIESLHDCTATTKGYIKQMSATGFYESFMHVIKVGSDCKLALRTASADPQYFIGDRVRQCSEVDAEASPEFACDMLIAIED